MSIETDGRGFEAHFPSVGRVSGTSAILDDDGKKEKREKKNGGGGGKINGIGKIRVAIFVFKSTNSLD